MPGRGLLLVYGEGESVRNCDVVIVGAGPGGLSAACAARAAGAETVLVLERDEQTGGVLNQCIHDGFGLVRYREMLTGPEYAALDRRAAIASGAEILTGAAVTGLTADRRVTAVTREGLRRFHAGAVVIATGCRERTRGAISIPGTRPAGIYTAGAAQRLMNISNIMVGHRVVILGSGDVGLIMSRRLTLSGAQVLCVLEMLPQPCGLERNISQCLCDFNIPLYVSRTVSRVCGSDRLTGIETVETDSDHRPILGTQRYVACDTLILSVGLIPENELAAKAGVRIDSQSNGVVTDKYLQSSVPGIFACGNARRVMDLADYVSVQGAAAGRNAALFAKGRPLEPAGDEGKNQMRKGLPTPNSITCILCPRGCAMQCSEDGQVKGNGCPRGAAYARQERSAPKRTLTASMRDTAGRAVPVKSSAPLPKEELLRAVQELHSVTLPAEKLPLHTAVISDFLHLGVDILTTAENQ